MGLQDEGVVPEVGTGADPMVSGGVLLIAQSSQILQLWYLLQPTLTPLVLANCWRDVGFWILSGSGVAGSSRGHWRQRGWAAVPHVNGEEPVLACPFLSLFWERPVGVALSQASCSWLHCRPFADTRSRHRHRRPFAPTQALFQAGSSSPQESRKGHKEGTETMRGP